MVGRHTLRVGTAVAVVCAVGIVLGAPSAQALTLTPDGSREPSHDPVSIDVSLPPGGSAFTSSPTLPSTASQTTFRIKTEKEEAAEAAVDMLVTLATRSPRARMMTCALIAYAGNQVVQQMAAGDYPESAFVVLKSARDQTALCLQVAHLLQSIGEVSSPIPTTRAAKCAQASISLPITTTADGISVTGDPVKAKPAVKISCRQSGADLAVSIKTKSKKVKLAKVVGPKLTLGFASPATATQSVPLKVTYGASR